MTTQAEIRESFWDSLPPSLATKRKRTVPNGRTPAGRMRYRPARQNDQVADIRVAFVDYVDDLARSGTIAETLANRATL